MKRTMLIICLLAYFGSAFAQKNPIGELTNEELTMKAYTGDTSAHAVVLKELGNAYFKIQQDSRIILEYTVRIKIFDNKGFDEGNVIIPIYKGDNLKYESVTNISGTTTYIDVNGKTVKASLDTKSVIKENKNSNWDLVKFTLPDLHEGCVIEYSYKLSSPFIFNFRSWEFQSDIPKIESKYVTTIPQVYHYNISYKGPYELIADLPELMKDCFTGGGSDLKTDCWKNTYVLDSVPAFVEEAYMTARSNFLSTINFELSEYTDYMGIKHGVTKEWKNIDEELMTSDVFGKQLQKKDVFATEIKALLGNQTDELLKAKTIFKHIQKWFKWDGSTGIYPDGLRKAYEKRSGNIADINLSLVSAMTSAGLFCEPVLLSTRNNGTINKLYPVVSDFNYVIARVQIGEKSYLLDASDSFLPFGLLPIHCINDQGRVMSFTRPSFWIDLKATHKSVDSYSLVLALDETGKIKGKLTNFSIGYEAHNKRKTIKKFNSVEEYIEDLDERYPKMKILKSEISNLDSLESTLSESYDIEIDAYDNLNQEKFLYNPFLMVKLTENPFKLAERLYAVDWGIPSETRLMLSLAFPDKFRVVSSPATARLGLPLDGGLFITTQEISENVIQLSQRTLFNKSIYTPEEYPYLKELFNKIVDTHKTDFVFEKKL